MVSKVTDAVKGIGEKIASFLHFSRPDEGPLADYESWMPDFMGGLAKGIKDAKSILTDEVGDLAFDVSAAFTTPSKGALGAVNSVMSNMTQNVTFNNSYTGSTPEIQEAIARTTQSSAADATTYMARGLAYARG